MSKTLIFILNLFLIANQISSSEAGFRCFFGDWACSLSCKVLGQQTGLCDDFKKCWCSQERLSLDTFKLMLPTRCSLGLPICQATCHAIGRKDGACNDDNCICSKDRLTPLEFSLCGSSSTCITYCQNNGHTSGKCEGWSCKCEGSVEELTEYSE